jgi:DNA-binding HxlR family transcriptional regulator
MRGIWVWPSDPKEQDKVLRKISGEDELSTILLALANNPEGLSNSKLDRLLANNSQWRTLSHMRELIALGFVEYHVHFFGDPGLYQLTDLGKTVLPRLQAIH